MTLSQLSSLISPYLTQVQRLQEVRLRVGQPVRVLAGNVWYLIGSHGLIEEKRQLVRQEEYFIPDKDYLENLLYLCCNKSIYAYNNQIIKGYLTTADGVRIGVCGKVVYDKQSVCAINDISSFTIRVPCEVKHCSDKILNKLALPSNVLVVSPPSCGKTTLIRDLARVLGESGLNVLVADERNEIAPFVDGRPLYQMKNCDVYSFCDKSYSFECGLRSMSPNVLVCDEISRQDVRMIENALNSGVCVCATIHAANAEEAVKRLGERLFDRYVVLSNRLGAGTVEGVFDGNLYVI